MSGSNSHMQVNAIKTRLFREEEDLLPFIREHIPELNDGTVLVVTSKIVALSEGRTAPVDQKERLIKEESTWARKTKYVTMTLKDGMIAASAGIDESNADGKLVLLPKDSYAAAADLRDELKRAYGIERLGIILSDSRIMPMRAGVVGVAVGYAGFKGIKDYRGTPDIFGRELKYTQKNIADGLATAAVVLMGEGSEQQPLCVIEDAPVEFAEAAERNELVIPPEDDMYQPLFEERF